MERRRLAASSISCPGGRPNPSESCSSIRHRSRGWISRRGLRSRSALTRRGRSSADTTDSPAATWTTMDGTIFPAFDRVVLRPRVFLDNGRGDDAVRHGRCDGRRSQRRNATRRDAAQRSARFPSSSTAGMSMQDLSAAGSCREIASLAVRGSFMRRAQDRLFGVTARVRRPLYVVRRNIAAGHQRPSHVGGRRRTAAGSIRPRELPQFDYRFSTPSVFMQDEIRISERWVFALSARADQHSEYGLLATPRVSVLSRPAPGWVIRLAAGTGTFAPTPFTEETEETGLSRVRPLRDLRAERARGASVDVTRIVGPDRGDRDAVRIARASTDSAASARQMATLN